MPDYRVLWEIDISAETPEAAARKALRIQRDPHSIATVFDVVSDLDGETTRVDIDALDDVEERDGEPE
jgi:hypothetical protein